MGNVVIDGATGIGQPGQIFLGIFFGLCGIIIVWLALRQRKNEQKEE